MEQPKITGVYKAKKGKAQMYVMIKEWKDEESGIFFAYAPALDITGYGNSAKEAMSSLDITMTEFLNYTHTKKTIYDELEKLGWNVNRRKKRSNAPDVEELIEDNETFRDLLNNHHVKDFEKQYGLE
ncbi:MAG: hypothetical protein PHE56_16665, partial [Bacteroidales bacterium]|nr:hypothetical protein [Bacteroidales bacterium]